MVYRRIYFDVCWLWTEFIEKDLGVRGREGRQLGRCLVGTYSHLCLGMTIGRSYEGWDFDWEED